MRRIYPTLSKYFPLLNTHIKILACLCVGLISSIRSVANVGITPASQTVYSCGNTFPTIYSGLGNITITEGNNGDFSVQTNATLILTAPANFEFQSGVGNVSYTVGQNITSATISVTSTTITVTFTVDKTNKGDVMTISGIFVRGITALSSGNITRTIANPGTGTIAGITNGATNFGTLTSVSQTVPIVTSAAAATICNNTAQNYSITSSTGSTSYLWGRASVAGISNGTVSNQSSSPITETLVNTGTAPVSATYIITPAANGCTGTAFNYVVTVNPTATVNAVSNQTVCNSLSTAAVNFSSPTTGGTITYNWTNNNTSIGLAASGSGNIASFTATNLTGSPITATITVTPSYLNSVACGGTAKTFTITVNPPPTTADAGPDQTGASVCGIVSVTLAGNNPTVGTGNWSIISNPDGLGSIANPALRNSSFSGTAGVTYILQWTISNATCVSSSDNMTVALVATPPSASAGSNLSLCGDASQATPTNANSITVGGGASASNYLSVLWTSSGTGTWTNQTSLAAASYTPSAADKTAGSVTITLTAYSSGTCSSASSSLILTLGKTILNNNIYLQTVCPVGATALVVIDQSGAALSGGDGTYLYTWGFSSPGNSGPFNPVTGYSNCSCPTMSVSQPSGNGFYIRTVTSGGCTAVSSSLHVNTSSAVSASTVNMSGGGSYCQGGSGLPIGLTNSVASAGEYYILYELYYNGAPMSPRDTVSGTGSAISFGIQTLAGTYTVYATPKVIGGSSCTQVQTTGSPSSLTITIDATATTSVAGPNQTICASSTSLAGNAPVTGTGLWTLKSGSGTITTATLRTSTVTSLGTGANVFRWTITNGTCSNYSDVTITVSQQSAAPTSASASVTSVCAGGSSVLTLNGGGGATGEVIKWYTGSCGGTAAGTGNSLSVTPAVTTTYYGRYEDGAPCNFVTACASVTVTVNVLSADPLQALASNGNICLGGSAVLTLSGGGGGTNEVVKWYTSSCGGTLVGTGNPLTVSPVVTTNYYGRYEDGAPCSAVTVCADVKVTVVAAGTWLGVTADWNNSNNWCSGIPNTSTKVFIPVLGTGLVYPSLSSDTAYCNDITIAAGASVTVNNFTLKISGNISNSGTFDASAGTIEITGTAAQTIPANAFKNNAVLNMIIHSPAGTSLAGALDIYRSFTFKGTGGTFTTGGFLTLKSSATETAWLGNTTGNTFSGSATVERYIPAGRKWRFLAVPAATTQSVKNSWMEGYVLPTSGISGYGMIITDDKSTALANGFDAQSVSGPSMKVYSGVTNTYTGITNTANPLSDYSAYMVFVRGDRNALPSNSTLNSTVLRVKGPLKTGAVQISGIPPGVITGVGNPYASAIDINSVLTASAGLSPNMYLWDPKLTSGYGLGAFQTLTNLGGYFIISPGGGSYGSAGSIMNTIESGQAFFIRPGGSTGTVNFNESVKTTGSSNAFFTAPYIQRLSALLLLRDANNNATLLDGATVYYNDASNNAVDYGDARKLTNTAENVSVRSNGILLSAEQRMLPAATDTLFINTANFRAGQYRWNISAAHLNDPARLGFLADQYTNTITPLNLNGDTFYDFTVVNIPGSYALNRFMVLYQQAGVVPVRFAGIRAVRNADKSASVSWDVQNELNIASYIVQRSDDGRSFTPAGTITATGSSNYSLTDSHAKPGYNYYRIEALESNGRSALSNIVKINPLNDASLIMVYPNPVKNKEIAVYFENQPSGIYVLNLFDNMGRVVFSRSVHISSASEIKNILLTDIAKGVYRMSITGNDAKTQILTVTVL